MYTLTVDYMMNRGHQMVITRTPNIIRTELEQLELQILQHSIVPYLLPIDWSEIDGNLQFSYQLEGNTMLIHRLQRAPFTMQEYYQFILSLVDALTSCEDYMLRLEGCLLHEHYIYIGSTWQNIKLTYIPLIDLEKYSEYRTLLSLLMHCTLFIESLDGNGLQHILRCFQTDIWPIELLRATVLHLMEQENSEDGIISYSASESATEVVSATQSWEETDSKSLLLQQPLSKIEKLEDVVEQPEQRNIDFQYDQQNSKNKSRKVIVTAIAILISAVVWRFIYVVEATTTRLYISTALTCFIVAVAYFIAKSEKSAQKLEEDDSEQTDAFPPFKREEDNSIDTEKFSSLVQAGISSSEQIDFRNNRSGAISTMKVWDGTLSTSKEQIVDNELTANTSSHHPEAILPTTVLSSDLLQSAISNDTINEHEKRVGLYMLHRIWAGETKKIELSSNLRKITIGRTAAIKEEVVGVSRLHLELERRGEQFFVKDLSSQNGSTLNQTSMIPYKAYPLHIADKIQLAGDDGPIYELRMLHRENN